jgi:hypothetical protein
MPGGDGDATPAGAAGMPSGAGPRRLPEPPTHPALDPRGHLAWLLRDQARACEAMGSPLYAHLLGGAGADVEGGGVCWSLLQAHVAPGRAGALALRFMAAVHRLVLTHRAPLLARHYPSVGGDGDSDAAWRAFRATLVERADEVAGLIMLPCQTNEVGRAAALVVGFLDVAARTGLPLRCLEVGASGGLNLRWDHFRYGGAGRAWGAASSPVDLRGHWEEPPAVTDNQLRAVVEVAERRGCDRRPVDPTVPEGRLALSAAVWADQTDRLERLRGALRVAADVPATVEAASLDEWTAKQLAEPAAGAATVVFHSVVEEYVDDPAHARFRTVLVDTAARATAEAPLAWLRLEPVSALRAHALTLTVWPDGEERLLAVCGAHGTGVRAPEPPHE